MISALIFWGIAFAMWWFLVYVPDRDRPPY